MSQNKSVTNLKLYKQSVIVSRLSSYRQTPAGNGLFLVNKILKLHTNVLILLGLVSFTVLSSCKKFLDADIDKSLITSDKVFSNDITATASIVSIYNDMANLTSLSGSYLGINSLTGLSGGDLRNYPNAPAFVEFQSHNISPLNIHNKSLWDNCYRFIYRTNELLRGLESSSQVTVSTVKQLKGEALFMRAFCYFYLANLYGDVPLVIGTDYEVNSKLPRVSVASIYNKIIEDLKSSQELLSEQYPTSGKVRPNKITATALLARVYLYLGEWANAEAQASIIMSNPNYALTPLNGAFLVNSNEAIWQIMSVIGNLDTVEGFYFIFTSTPRYHVLTNTFLNSFEINDGRRTSWIGSRTISAGTFYYPFKYKIGVKLTTAPNTYYSTPLRLAEQYLIRAEALAKQNKLAEAITDLDKVRDRAGLPLIANTNPSIGQADLLLAIERERNSELFTEWGHRWFDLKRTNRALAVIGGAITQNDLLWPIPQNEFDRNPNLGQQNPGY